MKSQSGRLQRLLELPQERSADRRRALITEIAGQFRDRSPASVRENQALGETLLKLLPKIELSDRIHLATQLASLKEAPTYLVRELAGDAPAVAAPILASSRLLVEDDLMAAARKGGEERLAAIAQRPDLSKLLQAVIAKSGEGSALLALVQNVCFAPSSDLITSLIVRARSDERLASSLAERREMPVTALAELFFSLKAEGRAQLTHTLGKSAEFAPLPPRANPEGEGALIKAVRSGDRSGLLRVLASHWKLAEASAERILRDATCEALAVLCLGLGIGRATYSTLAILMRPDAGDSSSRMLSQFERFSPAGCRRIALEWLKGVAVTQAPTVPGIKTADAPRSPLPVAKPPPATSEGPVPRGKVFGRLRPNKAKSKSLIEDGPPSTFGVTFGSGKTDGI